MGHKERGGRPTRKQTSRFGVAAYFSDRVWIDTHTHPSPRKLALEWMKYLLYEKKNPESSSSVLIKIKALLRKREGKKGEAWCLKLRLPLAAPCVYYDSTRIPRDSKHRERMGAVLVPPPLPRRAVSLCIFIIMKILAVCVCVVRDAENCFTHLLRPLAQDVRFDWFF